MHHVPRMDRGRLGKGGNGKVSKHVIANQEIAAKEVRGIHAT